MPLKVLQRRHWTGPPVEIGDLFILHKNRRNAGAVIFSPAGRCGSSWAPRATFVQTQVCHTQNEVLSTAEQSKTALAEKGWS